MILSEAGSTPHLVRGKLLPDQAPAWNRLGKWSINTGARGCILLVTTSRRGGRPRPRPLFAALCSLRLFCSGAVSVAFAAEKNTSGSSEAIFFAELGLLLLVGRGLGELMQKLGQPAVMGQLLGGLLLGLRCSV